MKSYPKINWWTGNLRPYESVLGFAVRFCSLNHVSIQQFENFFGFEMDRADEIDGADVQRIADLLNEDLSTVKTIFYSSFMLGSLASQNNELDYIRFCGECVNRGYHSFLHQVSWLSKCPFHQTSLKVSIQNVKGSSKLAKRFSSLMLTMKAGCQSWPYASNEDLLLDGNEIFDCVLNWAKTANAARARLLQGFKWSFPMNGQYEGRSLTQSIGQLRSLEEIPQKIEHLFTTLGEPWLIDRRHFPLEVKNKLKFINLSQNFELLFDFFKFVGKYANKPGSFMEKLRAAQNAIRERHPLCQCGWGRRRDGFYYNWVHVHPDQWPHWCCKCPYEVAIEELELGWGRAEEILTSRKCEEQKLNFIRQSKHFFDAGFIGYTPDANVSAEGHLYMYPQTWPCCEWVDNSKLGELLNAIAEFEIEVAYLSLISWLNNVDDGENPGNRSDSSNCIYLCETEEGVTLFKWMQKKIVFDSIQHPNPNPNG